MRSQIPTEDENLFPGMPVSPASDNTLRIQTGSQSLESTLSDNGIKTAIAEAANNDKDIVVEQITDDIFRTLMSEMKVELDILLMSDPRRKDEYILSESGRFLIFERRGIKTDLFAIERYVEEILDEVLSNHILFILF